MNPIALVMLGTGALMVWSGITNRDPIDVVRSVLTGRGVPSSGSAPTVGQGVNPANSASNNPNSGTVNGSGSSGSGGPNRRI